MFQKSPKAKSMKPQEFYDNSLVQKISRRDLSNR